MASELVIQTVGLTKVFRDFWGRQRVLAVDSLDLGICPGEVYGLLGPNGSGKSTTIKMLLGLLFPSRGWAKVLGQPSGDVKTNARIGYLPEESHLYPFLNARETLDFYGRLFNLSYADRRKRIDSLLEMVGLSGVGKRPVGEFSKGMARRIGLAQALINDPDLLILDEPTSGMDPIGTRQIKDLIGELGRRGKTVLLCSHLLADAEDVCDRICVLYGGKIQAQGPVDELLARVDMTQIRTGKLSEETIGKVKSLIKAEFGSVHVDVETPRAKLEEFFLQIVAQAQAASHATSGVIAGSGVSDFLSAPAESTAQGKKVIDELVAGGDIANRQQKDKQSSSGDEQPGTGVVKVEAARKPRRDVLDSLVGASSADGKAAVDDSLTTHIEPVSPTKLAESKSTEPAASNNQNIDHCVIDGLLDHGNKTPAAKDTDKNADHHAKENTENGNAADENNKNATSRDE